MQQIQKSNHPLILYEITCSQLFTKAFLINLKQASELHARLGAAIFIPLDKHYFKAIIQSTIFIILKVIRLKE